MRWAHGDVEGQESQQNRRGDVGTWPRLLRAPGKAGPGLGETLNWDALEDFALGWM